MDPSPLTVVATFRARVGREEVLAAALRSMLAATRPEDGCLHYDLYRADDDPGLFFFHETWRSADDHRAHLATAHVRQLLTMTSDLLAEPIRELKGRRISEEPT